MGKLILCSHGLALVPYYIENMALNIYSLEELCCYMKQNIDLMEPSFMDDELILWIEAEAKLPELAGKLRRKKAEGCGLSEFVTILASGCSYCSREEIQMMQDSLADFENKDETECRKIRADRLLEKKRYGASILEYQKLLALPGVSGMPAGNIYHNLGTAYAGLFLFKEAASCYERAFARNKNPLSEKQYQTALRLAEFGGCPAKCGEEPLPEGILEQWKEDYLQSVR